MPRRIAIHLALLIALAPAIRGVGGTASADDPAPAQDPAVDPPVVAMAMPLPDGTWLGPHLGLVAPPARPDARWVVAKVGTRSFEGRSVDVYGYVRADSAASQEFYAQADFVDPSTGEVVGGVWGRHELWQEAEPAPSGCAVAEPGR